MIKELKWSYFCWNCLYFSLASSTTMNGASSERQQRERPRQIVFVTDNSSHQCKQLQGKRLHILLQWFIHHQMLVIYILVQIIGLHMSFCVQASFLSMYILNCIHPSTIHTAVSWWSALFWAKLYQTTALSIFQHFEIIIAPTWPMSSAWTKTCALPHFAKDPLHPCSYQYQWADVLHYTADEQTTM